ncbi:MAG: FG-GAP-like repeat-containing protein [Candidatus Eisenbacteria bacterium]
MIHRRFAALLHAVPLRSALVLVFLLAAPAPAAFADLQYVESSTGLTPPELEAGRTEVEFSDVNADGRLDLVSIGDHGNPYVNTDEHGIMVWFGDGLGGWSCFQTGQFGYGGVALGDVNGDGLIDAAYGMHHDYAPGDLGDQLLEVALGDGTGRAWTPWDDGLATAGEDWGMFGTDLADIDNDGDLDVGSVSFGCCAGLHVYANDGDGSWTHTWGFLGGNSSQDFLFGDVDNDGFPDLVAAQQYGTVYLNDQQGGFVNADAGLPGGAAYRTGPSLGDVDNDGDLDLAYRASDASLQVWLWNGPGAWANASAGLPASGIAATQLRDMDGDGWIDVIGLGNGLLRVWLGNGGTAWTLAYSRQFASPGNFTALRAGGDVDHNGRPDLALIVEEGSWPSEQNVFHVLREGSAPAALAIRAEAPRGGERFVAGSVRFVDWITSIPGGAQGSVSIDLSLDGAGGPWIPVAAGLADGGRYQWRVPVLPATDQARLRLRVDVNGEIAETITPRAFTILPPVAAALPEAGMAGAARVAWIAPNPSPGGAVRIVLTSALAAGAEPGAATVRIVDVAGRLVRELAAPRPPAAGEGQGPSVLVWDGAGADGRPVPAGVYSVVAAGTKVRLVRLR